MQDSEIIDTLTLKQKLSMMNMMGSMHGRAKEIMILTGDITKKKYIYYKWLHSFEWRQTRFYEIFDTANDVNKKS